MKRIIAFLLLVTILGSMVACQEEPTDNTEITSSVAETTVGTDEITQAPSEPEVLPAASQFSFVYGEDVSEEIKEAVEDLRFLAKMEILKEDLAINPQTPTAHRIVIGGHGALASSVREGLEVNTYTVRGVKEEGAWSLLAVGNNQRSTLAAIELLEQLMREKSWEELLAVNVTESLGLVYPKSVSIYGDSISTYPGVSNAMFYNSSLSDQKVWYSSSQLKKSETWWSVVNQALGSRLCVDNAYSGDWTGSEFALNRAKNLHRDAMGEIQNPDTIIVYFGINDCWRRDASVQPSFVDCYGAIIRTMKETYPDAQIFCCTLLPGYEYKGERLAPINRGIRSVAKAEGVDLIDLDQRIGAEFLEQLPELTVDAENLHPNAKGMKMMGDAIAAAINEWYYGESSQR